MITLAFGKLRRFCFGHLRKGWMKRQESVRKGDCARCGACCKLLYHCPFLKEEAPGVSRCSVHGSRPINCSMFPIDKRDLKDRNIISPKTKCGYSFD